MNVVGVDVGATKIAAAAVSPEGEVLSRVRYPTPNSRSTLLQTLAQVISEVSEGLEVAGVGLGVPGLILAQESKVIFSPNLHAIVGIPLKDELEPKVGLSVAVDNDNNAAAWASSSSGRAAEQSTCCTWVSVLALVEGSSCTNNFCVVRRGQEGSWDT